MSQRLLFHDDERAAASSRHLARGTDPAPSKVAAARVVRSGQDKTDGELILSVLRAYGPQTAGEIAWHLGDGWDNVRVTRRTRELARSGFVVEDGERKCTRKGSVMTVWKAT